MSVIPPTLPTNVDMTAMPASPIPEQVLEELVKRPDYLPIDSHGMIGNMKTCCLVGTEGSIDWLCFPQFNSGSMFGRILDCEKGGSFSVHALSFIKSKQHYWPDTNILITRFISKTGIGELVDFMPAGSPKQNMCFGNYLIRKVRCIHGTMDFRMMCCPAFNYARDMHNLTLMGQHSKIAHFQSDSANMFLYSSRPSLNRILSKKNNTIDVTGMDSITGDGVECCFTIEEDDSVTFLLASEEEPLSPHCELHLDEFADDLMHHTLDFWHDWLKNCTYKGRWREQVHRSALALKLLTFDKTGAIIAAPTTSLPEGIGGVRNWDYRFTWIRDASFTLYSFMR